MKDIRIVVLQRGWVAVGEYSKDGAQCKLEKAAIVRRWGTQKGLPQLATEGPLRETILDISPTIKFHELTEVLSIQCNPEKWDVLK
jgi:hypothetical protein